MVNARLTATLLALSILLVACPNSTKPSVGHSLSGNTGQKQSQDPEITKILEGEDCLQVATLVEHLKTLEKNESLIYQSSAGLVQKAAGRDNTSEPMVNSCYYFPPTEPANALAQPPIVEWMSNANLTESLLVGKYLSLEQNGCDGFLIGSESFTLDRNSSVAAKVARGKGVKASGIGGSRLELLGEAGEHIIYRENGSQLTITTQTPVTVAGRAWIDQREYVVNHTNPSANFRLKVSFAQLLQDTLKVVPTALDSVVNDNLKLNSKNKDNDKDKKDVTKKVVITMDSVAIDLASMMLIVEKISKRQFKTDRCK